MTTCDCANNLVVDSRRTVGGVRRRRECLQCGRRWLTLEIEVCESGRHGTVTAQELLMRRMRSSLLNDLKDELVLHIMGFTSSTQMEQTLPAGIHRHHKESSDGKSEEGQQEGQRQEAEGLT